MLLSPGDVEDVGDDFDVAVDRAKVGETVEKAIHRLPILEKARISGGWAGLRPLTPDDHAIIGWAPGVEGFFVAVGFGGHGFQHSPTTGRVVSEWLIEARRRWTSRSSPRIDSRAGRPPRTTPAPTPSSKSPRPGC